MSSWATVAERFWDWVEPAGDCWIWTGTCADGYGYAGLIDGKVWSAHRFAYFELVGPPPAGTRLFRLCRDRACVNPDHLQPAKAGENLRRGDRASANTAKTHCPRGHLYDEENTYITKRGGRVCRQCQREKAAQVVKAAPKPRKRKRVVHGRIASYARGCRCDKCKSAMSAYQAERRAQAKQPREPQACVWCQGEFQSGRGGALYCSMRCRMASYRAGNTLRKPRLPYALVTEWFIEPDPDLAMLAGIAAEQARTKPKAQPKRR